MIGSALIKDAELSGFGFIPSESALDMVMDHISPPDQLISDFADRGDIVGIFGKSKTKKSWFVEQLCISLATGTPFLDLVIPRKFTVLLYQLEVQRDHYARRIQLTVGGLFGVGEFQSGLDNLTIKHCRGRGLTAELIKEEVEGLRPDVVAIDPIYPLYDAENEASDTKRLQSVLNQIAELGTAVLYVHHDKKGKSGDMDLVDRGSGSSILGRAYDAAFYLDPHATLSDCQVVSSLTRNYRSDMPFAVEWESGVYRTASSEVSSEVQTTNTASRSKARGPSVEALAKQAKTLLPSHPVEKSKVVLLLADKLGVGQRKVLQVIEYMADPDFGGMLKTSQGKNNKVILTLIQEEYDDLLD